MSVSKTYIAVIIVLVILIGFILSVIAVLARTAGQRIRLDMNRVLSNYDDIIAKKMEKINELNENLNNRNHYEGNAVGFNKNDDTKNITPVKEEEKIPISSFVRTASNYRDDYLADGYESIKNAFSYTEKQKQKNVEIIESEIEESNLAKKASKLASKFSYEDVYELVIKKPDEQLAILDKKLSKDDKTLLNNYMDLYGNKKFDVIKFADWVKRVARDGSSKVNVRTSFADDKNYDPSICDGYQIYVGNKMYDYGISKKEVS